MLVHLQIMAHLFFCSGCTRKNELYEASRKIMADNFFPQSSDLEDSIMSKIAAEESVEYEIQEEEMPLTSGELSTRGWIVAGIIVLVSLTSAFFGFEFNQLANAEGISFLLPIGITIGIVLTSYGAFFIGSHLKELSKRFKLLISPDKAKCKTF